MINKWVISILSVPPEEVGISAKQGGGQKEDEEAETSKGGSVKKSWIIVHGVKGRGRKGVSCESTRIPPHRVRMLAATYEKKGLQIRGWDARRSD